MAQRLAPAAAVTARTTLIQKMTGTVPLLAFFDSSTTQQEGDKEELVSTSRAMEQNKSDEKVLMVLQGYVMGHGLGAIRGVAVMVRAMDLDLEHGVYLAQHWSVH